MPSDHHIIARRLREVRQAAYEPLEGCPLPLLGVAAATWRNYESGVVVPDILLGLIESTAVRPEWLLLGTGDMINPSVCG